MGMVKITCACGCGRTKMVREADIKRGWGKYYSKSCKAKAQEKRTGQYKNYLNKRSMRTSEGFAVDDSFVGLTDQELDACKDGMVTKISRKINHLILGE